MEPFGTQLNNTMRCQTANEHDITGRKLDWTICQFVEQV